MILKMKSSEKRKSVINVKKLKNGKEECTVTSFLILIRRRCDECFPLFKVCGEDEDINIDIVPLFETMEGLANAEKVMQDLYNDEVYQKHLAKRKRANDNAGYFSDGTKDGGYLKPIGKFMPNQRKTF